MIKIKKHKVSSAKRKGFWIGFITVGILVILFLFLAAVTNPKVSSLFTISSPLAIVILVIGLLFSIGLYSLIGGLIGMFVAWLMEKRKK